MGVFGENVGNAVGRQLAGQLPHGMRAHAIGHHRQVASAAPLLLIARRHGGVGILIMAALDAHVCQACVFYVFEASHPSYPGWLVSSCLVYATPGTGPWIVPVFPCRS